MPFELRQPLVVHRATPLSLTSVAAAGPSIAPAATAMASLAFVKQAAQPLPAFQLATFNTATLNTTTADSSGLTVRRLDTPPFRDAFTSVAVVQPNASLLIDPRLLAGFHLGFNPDQPRSAFHLPTLFSPDPNPGASTLFEEPEDASRRRFVPAYSLATRRGPTSDLKWVALEPSEGGTWILTVHLTPAPPPTAPAGSTVAPLPPEVAARYSVKATSPQTGQLFTWDFDEVADDGGVLRLTLHLRGAEAISQRDRLYLSMTDPAARAVLSISHSLSLALPSDSAAPGSRPNGAATLTAGTIRPKFIIDRQTGEADVPTFIGRRPIRRPPAQDTPSPLFHAQTTVVTREIPFTFLRDLDANVFERMSGAPAGSAGLNHLTATYQGRAYPYFQETDQPEVFYFLPDAFKLSRRPAAPFYPLLAVAVEGESIEAARFTLSYWASPVWDPARIAAAAEELKPHAAPLLPKLVPFDAAQPKLRLKLPTEGGPAYVEQESAIVSLVAGIRGSVTLPLAPFQRVYSSLFDSVGELLSGEVRVEVGGETSQILFTARASDLVGEIFERSQEPDTTSGGLKATLRNAIESPITLSSLAATLVLGEARSSLELGAIDPPLPATLAPATATAAGQSLSLIAVPSAGAAPLDGDSVVLLDLHSVQVAPDPQRIWDVILDQSVAPVASRGVTVKLPAVVFTPTPERMVLAVQIEFESGATASFEAPATPPSGPFLAADVSIDVPLADYVLSRPNLGSYRYRVRSVTASAITESEWKTAATDVLFVIPG